MTRQRFCFFCWLAENFWMILLVLAVIGIALFEASNSFGCEYDTIIMNEAWRKGVPGDVAVAICHAESSGNPKAVGPGGERGLFQIGEATWRGQTRKPFSDAFDAQLNAQIAIERMARAQTSDPRELVAWHNAGRKDWRKLNPKWTVNHPNRTYRAIYRSGRAQ